MSTALVQRSPAEVQIADALCEGFERCGGWMSPNVLQMFVPASPVKQLLEEGWVVRGRSEIGYQPGFNPGPRLKAIYELER